MATAAAVLPFPTPHPRPVKAQLRANVQRDVQQIITLAPAIGRQGSKISASVVNYMRCLIPDPPPGDQELVPERRAAAADKRASRRRASSVRQLHPSVDDHVPTLWTEQRASALAALDLALGHVPAAWRRPARVACG